MRSAYASKRKNSTNAKIIICVGFCVQNVLDFPLDHLYALNIAFSRNSELRLTTFCTWSLSILQQWTAASLRSPPANAALLPPRRSPETTRYLYDRKQSSSFTLPTMAEEDQQPAKVCPMREYETLCAPKTAW